MSIKQTPIRSMVFETDTNTIACSTASGFAILDASSGHVLSKCSTKSHPMFPNGVRLISTLGDSNAVAISPNTDSSPHVFIWDKRQNVELASVKLPESVNGIRLRPDLLVSSTAKQIQIRTLLNFSVIQSYETAFNKVGIFDIPGTFASSLIAYPAPDIGVVTIANYIDSTFRPLHVHAFRTPIQFIKFSNNGRLLAVAGDDGKSIIVYSVPSMKPIITLRRGMSDSILAMSFEPHGTQLAVSSEKGLIHVFPIAWAEPETDPDSKANSRAPVKLKDTEDQPGWVCFSSKTLKLCGLTCQGQLFEVAFDEQMKASLNFLPAKIPL